MGIVFDPELDPVPFRDPNRILSVDPSVTISCPWPAPKINFDELVVVSKILSKVVMRQAQAVRVLFFTNIDPRLVLEIEAVRRNVLTALTNGNPVLRAAIEVVVYPTLHRHEFLEQSATAHLALDAFPFGGCLTVLVST
jgi:hypothetical protein